SRLRKHNVKHKIIKSSKQLVTFFLYKDLERVSRMPIIEVTHLQKSFGDLQVLKDISFTVKKNDVVAIIGPSGSGKSTMLRSLINLEQANGGTIKIDGDYLVKNGEF